MAEAAGLSAQGTVRRVEHVTTRLLRELPAAAAEVAAMPAGAGMLDLFGERIERRATEVRAHARADGTTPADDSEDTDPTTGASAYSQPR